LAEELELGVKPARQMIAFLDLRRHQAARGLSPLSGASTCANHVSPAFSSYLGASPILMDHLSFNWELNVGKHGVDADPSNPLSRAFRGLLEQGIPYESHSLCFYFGEEQDLRTRRGLRWLGVFLLSAGNRVIFFPGLSVPIDWIDTTTTGSTSPRRPFDLDHVSLEPSRQRWHFTTPQSQDHYSAGRTPDVGDGRLLWFGLSLSSENVLREVSKSTEVLYPSPPSDTTRRLELLRDAEQSASSHSIGLMNGSRTRFSPGFLHFTFVVGPRDAPNYNGPNLLFPFGSPDLEQPLPPQIPNLQIRLHRVALASTYDIQIACMWLPGRITLPGVYTTHTRL